MCALSVQFCSQQQHDYSPPNACSVVAKQISVTATSGAVPTKQPILSMRQYIIVSYPYSMLATIPRFLVVKASR